MQSYWKEKMRAPEKPEYFFWSAAVLAFVLFLNAGAGAAPSSLPLVAGGARVTEKQNPYESLTLEARAVFVYDLKTRRSLFRKNADAALPLASVTKLMTALTALALIPETTEITITDRALAEDGDTGLRAGEHWLLRELLKKMLLESSNDAAYAVASEAGRIAFGTEDATVGRFFFITRMNENAKKLGLTHTFFRNESGLDLSETETGAVSTAREAAYLLGTVLVSHPSVFSATRWEELAIEDANGETRRVTNTNHDTAKFPLLLASKTGYTDLAGGNIVIAFDADFNHPLIASVLGSSREGRFTDAEKLVWATLEYLQNYSN